MIGQTLAHYNILEKIGSGGMGDVYLAEDTKLDRKVALKVLPPDLAENEQRRARFQREAKAIAALDHPNIVTVHSVEDADGIHFITMQLVQGKTLTELLPKNGFPLNKFFDVAIPLADAVAAAHQEGITHRDLKPDNVMVGDDGRIKVLDFGLAKPATGIAAGSEAPTAAQTAEGMIVGTVAYMSPEQAEAKPVDHRSDIFSIGILLYEIVTGQRPFRGDAPTSILSSIIKDTPASVTELNPNLPRDLGKIVRRCLAKDPEHRFQSAKDIRNELQELKQEVESGEAVVGVAPARMKRARRSTALWFVGVVVGLTAIAWMAGILPTADRESVVPRLTSPAQLTSAIGVEDYPTWSPDGRTLAYAAMDEGTLTAGNWDIWVANVGGAPPINRTVDHTGTDMCPSWSPDGSQIAFWSNRDGPGYYIMSAFGGAARKWISSGRADPGPPQWSPDGEELAGAVADEGGNFVEIISLRSQQSRRLALPGYTDDRLDLSWSPDGRLFAYVDTFGANNDVTRLWIVRVADGEAFSVTDGGSQVWSPAWSAEAGSLLFLSNHGGSMDLWRQRVRSSGAPAGDPETVSVGMIMRRALLSRDGTKLAYSRGRRVSNLWKVPILSDRPAGWEDARQLTFDEAHVEFVDVSPKRDRLVVAWDRAGNRDVWILPVDGGETVQMTKDPAPDWTPVWSPDGEEIVFASYRTGNRDVWIMPVSGGPARQLTDGASSGSSHWYPTWSPDGREISYHVAPVGIWALPTEGGKPRRVSAEGIDAAPWSPDGRWLVSRSDEQAVRHIVRLPTSGGDPEPLVAGTFPRWSLDGTRVFYIASHEQTTGEIWAVSLVDGSTRPLTALAGRHGGLNRTALATDGSNLYFAWEENVGDIWVMDVVTDEDP